MAQYKGAAKEASRAMNLLKKRQKEKQELELRKKKIEEESKVGVIDQKFAVHYDAVENQLKTDTIGLVTLDQMKAKQDEVLKERERQMVAMKEMAMGGGGEKIKESKKKQGPISFCMDGDEEDDDDSDDDDDEDDESEIKEENEESSKRKNKETESGDDAKRFKMMKCPFVDTSFLPDREREAKDATMREKLRQEWTEKQERIKNEEIEITYSYWDGSGHRRVVRMRKGNTIQQFLQKCLEQLKNEFNELKTSSVDRLMYIKEDLIIAQHYSFYDFIVTKARGKSGALFSFDVHQDVRLMSDAGVEKDESHAGKVCLRSWYDKNKHIFPASRWEPYDPDKEFSKYTISDKHVDIK